MISSGGSPLDFTYTTLARTFDEVQIDPLEKPALDRLSPDAV